jgi:uncharacterized protein
LGLLGFGFTVVLLSLSLAEVYPMGAMNIAMVLAYGGFAEILCGIFRFCAGDGFGTLVFCSYGFFCVSFACLSLWPNIISETTNADGTKNHVALFPGQTSVGLGYYMFLWGLKTFCLMIVTMKFASYMMIFTFFTAVVLFWLLAA